MSSTPVQPNGNGGPYGPNAASKTSSEVSFQRLKNLPGYTTPVFKGKQEQRAKVQADVAAKVRHIAVIDNPDQLSDLAPSH
jgi:glutamate dehydrogenase